MKRLLIHVLVASLVASPARGAGLPLNPDVTPQTMRGTICVPGWTSRVRPPVSYTQSLKRRLLPPGGRMADYELDHTIPLSLGGAPSDPKNLKLQPWPEARLKDQVELRLARMVCQGRLTLDAARKAIWSNWKAWLQKEGAKPLQELRPVNPPDIRP